MFWGFGTPRPKPKPAPGTNTRGYRVSLICHSGGDTAESRPHRGLENREAERVIILPSLRPQESPRNGLFVHPRQLTRRIRWCDCVFYEKRLADVW